MNNGSEILILNTGGTFNKVYNTVSGELDVPKNNCAIEDILKKSYIKDVDIKGIIYKDSLDMDDNDREEIVQFLQKQPYVKIIIVHGTDTMGLSAEYISSRISNRSIVFTGAMVPYSIEKTEAVANIMSCYGFLKATDRYGVYIGMHGLIKKHGEIKKNKQLGIFECRK